MGLSNKYTITQETFTSLDNIWKSQSALKWDTLFTLPPWMSSWWQVFGDDSELYLRAIRQDDRILGIAPLMIKNGTAYIIGSANVVDYVDFISSPGYEKEFFNVLLDHLQEKGVQELNLESVRAESAALTYLAVVAKEKGLEVITREEEVCPSVDLPARWEDYLTALTSKQRHEINRKLRRLSEAGEINYRVIKDEAEAPPAMDTFLKLFMEYREDKTTFMTAQMDSYFRALAQKMAQAGLLKLGILEMDRTVIAMIMCFDYQGITYLYNSSYDPHYREVSAGLMSKVLSIKESIESGQKKYDFLKGDEDYKYQLGGRKVPLFGCKIILK